MSRLVCGFDFHTCVKHQFLHIMTVKLRYFQGHVFDIECGLPFFNEMSTVSGILNKTFDEASGRAQFDAVALSGYGPTYLECTIVSSKLKCLFQVC